VQGPFAAVVFDMDGVLVDGEPLHFRAVNELLATEGKAISLEAYKPYMGTKSGWADMIRDLGLTGDQATYSEAYRPRILELYRTQSEPLPGAIDLVRGVRAQGLRVGVASSSIRPWVEACLERLGLGDSFDVIITGSDVENGKPDPAIYLLAAERIGHEPAECLAIEDAPAGILAAHAAGMTCWAVRTEYTRGLPLPDPDRVFESLLDVDVSGIAGIAA
jgi:HAD superfamily hydrolase (TIGR01509 family)